MAKKSNKRTVQPSAVTKPTARPVQPVAKDGQKGGSVVATASKGLSGNAWLFLILLVVAILGYLLYAPSFKYGFTQWDDQTYVTNNKDITDWSSKGIGHLFHSYTAGNYHPITMLSYAMEYHAAQLKPYVYHRDSLILNLLVSLVIVLLTWVLTRKPLITAFAGILFVVHPMHVESVSWISGRKDLLFGLFYFLSLIGWYYYIKANRNKYLFYLACVLLFALALLSKATAVTLPVVCLLIDYYLKRPLKINLLIEKIPLFILSIVFGIISVKAQASYGAILAIPNINFVDRVCIASYAFVDYIAKLFLPLDLSNFYPYPLKTNGTLPGAWYAYPFALLALFFIVYRYGGKNRAVVVGFLFYAITIFLLLQFLAVGGCIMADRYSYVPYFGLIFILGYFFDKAVSGVPKWIRPYRTIIPLIAAGWFIYLAIATINREAVWKDNESLWKDAIIKQPLMADFQNNLGTEYSSQERNDEALPLFNRAIELDPNSSKPYYNRAEIYRKEGKNELALNDLNKSISLDSSNPLALMSRGIVFSIKGRFDSSGRDFNRSIQIYPDNAAAYLNRGNFYMMTNHFDSAMKDYNKTLELDPGIASAYTNRGWARINHQEYDAGIEDLNTYLKLMPESGEGYIKRSYAYNYKKDFEKALDDANEAQKLGYKVDPAYIGQLNQLVKK